MPGYVQGLQGKNKGEMEKTLTNNCTACRGRGLQHQRTGDWSARTVSCPACFGTGRDTSAMFALSPQRLSELLEREARGELFEVIGCHHRQTDDPQGGLYAIELQKESGEKCAFVCCRSCRDRCLNDLAWLPEGAPWNT